MDNVIIGRGESVSPPLSSVNSSSLMLIGDVFGLRGRIGFRFTDASWSIFLIFGGGRDVFSRTSTLNQLLLGSLL